MKSAKSALIIFDLDGTLYELKGGSYQNSPLQRQVLKNARDYLAKKLAITQAEAQKLLKEIQRKYGEHISLGLEKEFGIDRYEYFNTVWNIAPSGIVKKK